MEFFFRNFIQFYEIHFCRYGSSSVILFDTTHLKVAQHSTAYWNYLNSLVEPVYIELLSDSLLQIIKKKLDSEEFNNFYLFVYKAKQG